MKNQEYRDFYIDGYTFIMYKSVRRRPLRYIKCVSRCSWRLTAAIMSAFTGQSENISRERKANVYYH